MVRKEESKIISEYSMGSLFFDRFNKFHEQMDELGIKVMTKHFEWVESYYSVMYGYYINLRPLFSKTLKKKFDDTFLIIKKDIKKETNKSLGIVSYPERLIDCLLFLHRDLIDQTQKHNLGIVVNISRSKGKDYETKLRA